ncbi:MAG: hypothetical protein AB4058_11240 [Microcystaceae cyanobacterium]
MWLKPTKTKLIQALSDLGISPNTSIFWEQRSPTWIVKIDEKLTELSP